MSFISGLKARFNGAQAERQASEYLTHRGLRIITKNYHCKWGEIDLILSHDEQLVFVEVKSRESKLFGEAGEYFTRAKRAKLTRSIMHYLQKQNLNPNHTNFRIDVIAITGKDIVWYQAV